MHRYRDLESVFDVDRLPRNKERFRSCQLIRGALAAHAHAASFAVFCDQRRQDLIEDCFEVISAVVSAELRCRMSVVTWQKLASAMPRKVRTFLAEKYGIGMSSKHLIAHSIAKVRDDQRAHWLHCCPVSLSCPVARLDGQPAPSGSRVSCSRLALTGIDVLEQQHFRLLQQLATRHGGRLRIGLMTNQTGLDAAGRRTVDVLFHDAARQVPGLTLTTLFSPEHGLSGLLDTAHINGGQHLAIADGPRWENRPAVISLFGDTDAQRHPQPEQLRTLDCGNDPDLQDAGVRFYTYETVVGVFSRGRRQERHGDNHS